MFNWPDRDHPQLELLEMRVETTLIQRVLEHELDIPRPNETTKPISGFGTEWRAWKKLFEERYRDRTWIGVLIMVFQRRCFFNGTGNFSWHSRHCKYHIIFP